MREIGVGVAGFGMMGKAHTYAYKTIPLYYSHLQFRPRLIGVCSGHLENARIAADEQGFETAFDSFDAMLADPGIDVVSICTPNNLHEDMILKAIAAGKHIYCDKPLTVNGQQSKRITQALLQSKADGQNLIHQAAFHNRFFPAIQRACQIMEQQQLGRILSFRIAYLHSGSVDPHKPISWKQDQAAGGGLLLDMGSHALDLLYYLMGDFKSIYARPVIAYKQRPDKSGKMVDVKAEDAVIMLVEMANGCSGTLEATKIATGAQDELRLEIHGTSGAIRFNLMDPNWLDYYDARLPEMAFGGSRGFTRLECVQRYAQPGGLFPANKTSIGWLRAHVDSVYQFLDCVARQRPASPSFFDASYIQDVMDVARRSMTTGKLVQIPARKISGSQRM